jgi:hypothetical protein
MKRGAWLLLLVCAAASTATSAQELSTKFSCSVTREEDERVIYADNGDIRLKGNRIETFRWESSLFRPTHGFDCSIDDSDGLQAEVIDDEAQAKWRIRLADARKAREMRGYDFSRGLNCTIRVERDGDTVSLKPSCPALCGSRKNFSELSVNTKTGKCRYEE